MKRTMAAAVLLGVLTLSGCSAGAASSISGGQGEAPNVVAPGTDKGAGSVNDSSGSQASPDRSVITTGTMTVTADDPLAASTEAVTIVEGVGGRIDARQENAPVDGNKGSATLTLRIPASVLSSTLDKLKKLGTVEQVSISATDVTGDVQDLDARIKAAQASVDRLTALLATAADADVLVKIESSLAQREADLESMQSQQRVLGDQTSMSTLTLSLISVADAPVKKPVTFFDGLLAGWNSFVAFILGALVVIGAILPWLAFLAIVGAIVWLIVRLSRRKKSAPPQV
jgi:Domain of unknown function (DUF4349)